MLKNKFLIFVFFPTIALFAILFWARGMLMLDPDFGWHLRMGEIILEKGIPKTDPFSYTMPSYPFVDHEWLTNVGLSKLHSLINITGLAVIFSLIITAALLIQIRFPVKKWSFVPFVLAAGSLLAFVGVRTQVISWFFFSILIFILFNQKAWKRRFLLPFLFIVWANLHGGFGMGVAALLAVITIRMWEKKRIIVSEIVLLFSCIAATFINPYGLHLWRELWMQISDTSLRWNIMEWMPALFNFNFTWWILVSYSVLAILRYIKKFHLSQLTLYFILLFAGLSSMRHLPFWLLLALPMTINALAWFAEEAKRYKDGVGRLNKVYAIFAIGVIFIVIVESAVNLDGTTFLQEETFYPKQAVGFLANHKSSGQLFSTYGWGGYLIWKMPEKKVFIDGRMPSWRWNSAPPSESNYAFEEFSKILSGKIPVQNAITKYNIDTFLLPIEKKKDVLPFLKKPQEILEKLLNRQNDSYEKFTKQLTDIGMIEIYKDSTSVIYRKENY